MYGAARTVVGVGSRLCRGPPFRSCLEVSGSRLTAVRISLPISIEGKERKVN